MKARVVRVWKQESVPTGLFTSACAAKLAVECESSCPTPTEETLNIRSAVQCSAGRHTFVVSKHNKDDQSTTLALFQMPHQHPNGECLLTSADCTDFVKLIAY